jgi:hypothetical protein
MQDLLNRLKQDLLVAVEALLAANRRISALAREMRVRACAMEADALEQQELLCSLQDSITGSVARAFVDHRKALQERVDRLARDRYAMPRVLQSVEELLCEVPNLGELQYMCSVLANIRLELDEAMQPIPRPTPQDELVPPFVETKFVIHDFERAFGEGTFVYTEQAAVYGNTWRLKVYPRGHMDAEGRFVSVFVEPVKGPVQPGWYDYRIELRSANLMEDPVIRLNRSEFVANRVLGWNKAIPIERLRRAQFLTRGGDFVIYLNLRPISYHQAYLDAMAALTEERERRALLAQASTMS